MSTENRIFTRFLDADEEPLRALTPIEGYEKEPLVSLEEAVQPLNHLLHNLNSMVSTAKWNSRKPHDNLTPDESAAIHLYTMQWHQPHHSLYTLLNQTLRSEQRTSLIPWFLYLKLFLTALYKLPSIKGAIWRGIHGNVSDHYDIDQMWWGVSSCTDTMQVMERFVGRSGVRTLFNIEATNGKAIKAHSHYKTENEILLMPGTYFQVKGKWSPAENLYIVHLIETDAPWQLITPPFILSLPVDSVSSDNITIPENTESTGHTTISKQFLPLCLTDISANSRWTQNGLTVAGGNEQGNAFNQLNHPCGLYVGNDQTVYIADRYNHRIVEWNRSETTGRVIAGGSGQGSESHQLSLPTDLIIDRESDSLIICDAENRRVVRWPCRGGTNGETIISNVDCFGLTMDDKGFLYVSDDIKNEVKRWRIGETRGTVVAGGNGKGNRLDQFNRPTFLFVDRDHSLYVSDYINHRVMKWVEGTQEGIVVAGGRGLGNDLVHVSYPRGVIVDQLGTIYVADFENHRIMRWLKGAKQGSVLVGGNGRGRQPNQINSPNGLSFDQHGNLYTVDSGNERIQKFNIDSSSCS